MDNDVGVVIRTLGKQFEEGCPRIAQFSLVVKSIDNDGRVQTVIGDESTPEGKFVCIDSAEIVGLLGFDEFLEVIDSVA